jgi:hypothetical protein
VRKRTRSGRPREATSQDGSRTIDLGPFRHEPPWAASSVTAAKTSSPWRNSSTVISRWLRGGYCGSRWLMLAHPEPPGR